MALTRRDFEMIAEVVWRTGRTSEERERWAVAFAARLRSGRSRFDTLRFVKECRVDGTVEHLESLARWADENHPAFV